MNLDVCKEKLGKELSPLLNVGAKVYLVENFRMGVVDTVAEQIVRINVGSKKWPVKMVLEMHEFYNKVMSDKIVGVNRAVFSEEGIFERVKPRTTPLPEVKVKEVQNPQKSAKAEQSTSTSGDFEVGFINEKTGKFSKEKKRGYTEIKFQKVKKKVELELDESQIERLKELGLL